MNFFNRIALHFSVVISLGFNIGCVSMALEAMKKVPSQKDVETMEIGLTKYEEVVRKWPDFNRNLVNEKVCLAYTKVNTAAQLGVIGGKADIVTLCFKDGILTDRTSN